MHRRRVLTEIKAEAAALTVLCSWELAALTTGLVPTVTSTVMRCPRPVRAALVAAATGWLAHHFELLIREVADETL